MPWGLPDGTLGRDRQGDAIEIAATMTTQVHGLSGVIITLTLLFSIDYLILPPIRRCLPWCPVDSGFDIGVVQSALSHRRRSMLPGRYCLTQTWPFTLLVVQSCISRSLSLADPLYRLDSDRRGFPPGTDTGAFACSTIDRSLSSIGEPRSPSTFTIPAARYRLDFCHCLTR